MDSFVNPPAFLKEQAKQKEAERQKAKQFPEQPERDVLLFLLEHAPLEPLAARRARASSARRRTTSPRRGRPRS